MFDNEVGRKLRDFSSDNNIKLIQHQIKEANLPNLQGGFLNIAMSLLPSLISPLINKIMGNGMSGGCMDCAECVCDKKQMKGMAVYGGAKPKFEAPVAKTGFVVDSPWTFQDLGDGKMKTMKLKNEENFRVENMMPKLRGVKKEPVVEKAVMKGNIKGGRKARNMKAPGTKGGSSLKNTDERNKEVAYALDGMPMDTMVNIEKPSMKGEGFLGDLVGSVPLIGPLTKIFGLGKGQRRRLTKTQIKNLENIYGGSLADIAKSSKAMVDFSKKLVQDPNVFENLKKAGLSEKMLKEIRGSGIFGDILGSIPLLGSVAGPLAKSIGLGKKPRAKKAKPSMQGDGFLSDLIGSVPILGSVAGPLAKSIGLGKTGGKKYVLNKTQGGRVQMLADGKIGFGKTGAGITGGVKRSDIVKKVMNEKGLSMIQASKYVKDNNLYKK